jgi:hypothetical protein
VVLEDKNEDGIFNGSFTLEKGCYSVDIETEDVFNNVRTFSNVTYLTQIIESSTEISTSVPETTETSTAFPELIIVLITLSVTVIHSRKQNRK